MGIYNRPYDRLGTKLGSAFIQKIGCDTLLKGPLKRTGKGPCNSTYNLQFSKNRKELGVIVNIPESEGVNRQNVNDVIDALYFLGFSRYSPRHIDGFSAGRITPTVPGEIGYEDGFFINVMNDGIAAKLDLEEEYNERSLNGFFRRFATWVDYLTGADFAIPDGIAPRWFRNKLEKGAEDFRGLEGGSELWTGFGAGQYLGITYKNLLKLEKFGRPYLAVHEGEGKSRLEIVTNVAAGLTDEILRDKFTQPKKRDYSETKIGQGTFGKRAVRVSKDNKQIKINVLGGKIKSPADVASLLTILCGYLYPSSQETE